VIRYLRDLIRDGYMGDVLSTTLVGSAISQGASAPEAQAYLNDRSTGATALTIPFGHAIDALCWCLGEFGTVWATLETRRKTFAVIETGEVRPMNVDDQIVVGGVLANGVTVSAHYRGGLSRGTNLLWEINGTKGDLQVTSAMGHLQMFDLTLRGPGGRHRARGAGHSGSLPDRTRRNCGFRRECWGSLCPVRARQRGAGSSSKFR